MRNFSIAKSGLLVLGLFSATAASAVAGMFNFSTLANVNNPNSSIPNLGGASSIGSTYNREFTIDMVNTTGVGNTSLNTVLMSQRLTCSQVRSRCY